MDRRTLLIGSSTAAAGLAGAAWLGLHGMGSMADYSATVAESRVALSENPGLRDVLRYATLAPNGHNTQPWRFRLGTDRIDLLADFARRTPIVDPDDHHIFVGLGCAAENIILAAGAIGREVELDLHGLPTGAIGLELHPGQAQASPLAQRLFAAIPLRQSTRSNYDGTRVGKAELDLLAAAAAMPGVSIDLITAREPIDRLRDLVLAGNTAQLSDLAFLRELKHWLRFNPRAAMVSRDGLFSVCSGSPALPSWAGPFLFDRVTTIAADNRRYASQMASSAGLVVFAGAAADPAHWVSVGRSCQRFALQATALGLKCAFLNQPVEVPALRPELAALVGLPGQRPDIVMRFGRADALPFSARRPVSALLLA